MTRGRNSSPVFPKRHRRRRHSRDFGQRPGLIVSLTKTRLWVLTVAMGLIAGSAFGALQFWETAHDRRVAAAQEVADNATRDCELMNCNAHTDKLLAKAADASERRREVNEFIATDAWVRPMVIMVVFGVAPCVALMTHWLWHKSNRRRARDFIV
ncbi:MAG: hypothetical protein ACREPM_12565 [Gemmatimonadaceae bacterium]